MTSLKSLHYKQRQEIYHRVFKQTDIKSEESYIVEHDKIVKRAVEYFTEHQEELYYPAKSYCVAIIYARLLEIHFGKDFYEALNDSSLLFHNDKYYRPYCEDKDIYDQILEQIPPDYTRLTLPNVQETVCHFLREFLLDTSLVVP